METLGIQKGIWRKEARVSCWPGFILPDPSRVQPHALWLRKLGCYMPCSLAYMFLPCSQVQVASLSG